MKKVFLLCLAVILVLAACKKLDFTKTEAPVPPQGDIWMSYDNGTNFTGVSANSGGNFDIAIRFNAGQLAEYDGYRITQVKFFPLTGYPAVYSVTIWEGQEPPSLLHVQETTVTSDAWNTAYINQSFYVDAGKDLWIGVWIQDYPYGSYPAGCDAGPAWAGRGDLYSTDDGQTWYSLYNTDGLNYNWNLQVFLDDMSGKKAVLAYGEDPSAKTGKEALRAILPEMKDTRMVSSK